MVEVHKTSENASLLVDDYVMYLLEQIREARLDFKAYMEDLSGIESKAPDYGIPLIYQGADFVEGQTAMSEVHDQIAAIFLLEHDLARHLERLVSMRDIVPLRQFDWHLHLSETELEPIIKSLQATPHLPFAAVHELEYADIWDYCEGDKHTVAFGYPPALLIEALYWPQWKAHHSK